MSLTLQELDHILKALDTMSSHDKARAREMIAPGITDHDRLVDKLQTYRYRLTRPWNVNIMSMVDFYHYNQSTY